MKLPEAIETLKDYRKGDFVGDDDFCKAIDTVIEWAEKPLPTDVQKEAWNAALEEVEDLMRKPCWDLTLCEDIKKLKK